jgi:hypothetical protein
LVEKRAIRAVFGPKALIQSGEMALRWAAAGMLAAQGQFRRVKGYQELPQLALALPRHRPGARPARPARRCR